MITLKTTIKLMLLVLALSFSTKTFAQEWEYMVEHYPTDSVSIDFIDAYQLSDGRIAICAQSYFSHSDTLSDSPQPSLMTFALDDSLLAQTTFLKPGYYGYSPIVVENDQGEFFAMMSFNPDHDYNSPNYFMNFENPSDHAILALYKLEDDLSIAASYEFEFVVDTFECRTQSWFAHPNRITGQTYLFSAFADKDDLVGGFHKSVSQVDYGGDPRGYDSTFFFKMSFEGLVDRMIAYEMTTSGKLYKDVEGTHQIVKDEGNHFIYYVAGTHEFNDVPTESLPFEQFVPRSPLRSGIAFFNSQFNLLRTRELWQATNMSYSPNSSFQYISTLRSKNGTTYLATVNCHEIQAPYEHSCRLCEVNDKIDGQEQVVPQIRWIERLSNEWDHNDQVAKTRAVDMLEDDCIIWGYTLNLGDSQFNDSWMMIECLDQEFDTIMTLFYDIRVNEDTRVRSEAYSVLALRDGGMLLVSNSFNIDDPDQGWATVTKFPTPSFWNIEEAHANGLKTAIAYPNPGKNVLNIRTGLKDAYVEVFDTNGRLVHTQALTEGVTPIATDDWPSGMYVWKVYTSGPSTLRPCSATLAESGKWVKD